MKRKDTPNAVARRLVRKNRDLKTWHALIPQEERLIRAIARALKAAEERGYHRGWNDRDGDDGLYEPTRSR